MLSVRFASDHRAEPPSSPTSDMSATTKQIRSARGEVLELEVAAKLAMTPWYNLYTAMPDRPLPPSSERPHIKTARLVLKPLELSDLDAFHALRTQPEVMAKTFRPRIDRDINETRTLLESLQSPNDGNSWRFGAFLASTGELIGDGGVYNYDDLWRTGWPELEFMLSKEHWGQGYGKELITALVDGWFKLPRSGVKKQSLHPNVIGELEPGDELPDTMAIIFDASIEPARKIVDGMTNPKPDYIADWQQIDWREGKEFQDVTLAGWLLANPNGLDPYRTESGSLSDRTDVEED
ncbi:GNAT domain-domain-containing protein [Microdochium bolleyi]|uniref:GNAT domain-domain-containing protein n=1 Tax=Microdochium bolleyi TaxID=196109 RepID=A0A136IWG7_9PEZI|nr:GNAT domain-domain-containing protein [Microdochium bolleyi]